MTSTAKIQHGARKVEADACLAKAKQEIFEAQICLNNGTDPESANACAHIVKLIDLLRQRIGA
jgi:hypothetical protein